MQICLKKILLFLAFYSLLIFNEGLTQRLYNKQPDSLLYNRDLEITLKTYEVAVSKNKNQPPINTLLKLAYMYEQQENIAKTLHYLCLAYKTSPQQTILNKIRSIAQKNNLSGYESDDWGFIFILFQQYFFYIILFFFAIGCYVFTVLVHKYNQKQVIHQRHKWIVLLYLGSLLIVTNLPNIYQMGIIANDKVFLRLKPSSASPALSVYGKGNKVNTIGQQGQWVKIILSGKVLYVRQSDLLLI